MVGLWLVSGLVEVLKAMYGSHLSFGFAWYRVRSSNNVLNFIIQVYYK